MQICFYSVTKGKHAYSDQHLLYGWFVQQVLCRRRHHQPHCRGLTSLPQNKSWHHRQADTAPLTRLDRHCAGPSLPLARSCDICALGSCWFAYRAREDPPPPPPPPVQCRKTLHLSPLLSPSAVLMLMLMEARIILPPSLPYISPALSSSLTRDSAQYTACLLLPWKQVWLFMTVRGQYAGR